MDLSDKNINALAYYFAYVLTDEEREELYCKPIREALEEENPIAKLFLKE